VAKKRTEKRAKKRTEKGEVRWQRLVDEEVKRAAGAAACKAMVGRF